MKQVLELESGMRIIGKNSRGHETAYDTSEQFGGNSSAPTPMEIMLQAVAACSFMDVASIIKKKRKQIDDFKITITGERRDAHPRIFTDVHMLFELTSPDAEFSDLERAISLSKEKYCSVSATVKGAGANVECEGILHRP